MAKVLATGLAALVAGVLATPAGAQEFRASGGSGAGSGGTRFVIGFEGIADDRQLAVDAYKESFVGPVNPPNTPPPPATEWDEDLIEHRIQYHARHTGAMIQLGALGGSGTPWRLGVKFGGVTAAIREEVFQGDYLYGFPLRITFELESKTGFGGGLFGDVRVPIQGQPIWVGAGFDATIGMVAMDNGGLFNTPNLVDGEYLFAWATAAARVGFTSRGVAPFVGVAGSFYYGDLQLDVVPALTGNGLDGHEAQFSTREYVRVLVGIEFWKGTEALARLQVGIGKPGDDLAVSVTAMFRV